MYLPQIFKAVMLDLVLWLLIHHVLRNWIYSGEIWYLILMDLSIIVIAVSVSLWILTRW
ncbi:MAG: DUF1656 domain-containing protein [Yersinia sp. (in: enterobacteria)]